MFGQLLFYEDKSISNCKIRPKEKETQHASFTPGINLMTSFTFQLNAFFSFSATH